jgi:hypothetical protein
LRTLAHIAESITIVGALFADFGASLANGTIERRIQQQDMRAAAAYLCACHHEPEMLRLHMRPALFETMGQRRTVAKLVTLKTLLNAVPHVRLNGMYSVHLICSSA